MNTRPVLVILLVVLATGPAFVGTAVSQPSGDLAHPDHGGASFTQDSACASPVEVTDTTGQQVTVEEEPQEIVVTGQNIAQHMWEIGAQEKVTSMPVRRTDYLEGSEAAADEELFVEGSGPADVLNTERVVDLDPDLVLAANTTSTDAIQELRDADVTVYHYALASNFETIMTQVDRTGRLVGACDAAANRTAQMDNRINLVSQATADVEEQPSVFYDLSQSDQGLYTINSGAFEHELLSLVGARNIAADVEGQFGGAYPQISQETVLEANPDVVVSPGPLSDFAQDRLVDQAGADAIQLNADLISQHAPRTVDVLEDLAEELHPDAMEQARGQTDTPPANNESDTIEDQQTNSDNSDDSGPGFAIVGAVGAVLALALIAARRRPIP